MTQTENLVNEIVTENINDSINPTNFTIPWTQVIQILIQILIAATPYLLASAGITLMTGTEIQTYVIKRHNKSNLFNLLLTWRVRHHIEKQANKRNFILTTVQSNDLTTRLLNKVMNTSTENLDAIVNENLNKGIK